jgi:glycerophosphoryl diester phosphodiesterase
LKRLPTARSQPGRPLIFAHRGASQIAPENTLPAFEAAAALGADGVELDVQYSSDGKLMVFHSLTLEATTDGQGRVSAHTLAELRALNASRHFGPSFAGVRIPTLDEVLDLLANRLIINIELKVPDLPSTTLGVDVAACVHAHGMAGQVIVSSFNPFALRRARQAGPDIECALLISPDLPAWMRWGVTRRHSRAVALHPEAHMVDAEAEMRRLIALGVDAIITDVPDRLAALL